MSDLLVFAPTGIPEIDAGTDLLVVIGDALARDPHGVTNGDIVAVTSKVVSKAEGRTAPASERSRVIDEETVRIVAERTSPDGRITRIVENRLGIVGAAAGVDGSNTAPGTILRLPVDPDASAAWLRSGLEARFGCRLGVVVTDTLGRAWRQGQTDVVIGAAGVRVLLNLAGTPDAGGRPLGVTAPAVGDEIAAAADLVLGKASGLPVAVLRGLGHLLDDAAPGARSLQYPADRDWFRQGSEEAYRAGFAAGRASAAP
ncbi:coenzyme F420-0:L-glutamate ligase [Curtobacterium ammoniigenes]|uniref:coenzyme F420-0:L-glutamate ligase n=1 Tax=Curtobacterium ammoniigenes TaxID=395387 RepID=UPI0008349235|nr:coenzyme F420-0:L-glutamate ligase [Curtobacterium ammoniigenes]